MKVDAQGNVTLIDRDTGKPFSSVLMSARETLAAAAIAADGDPRYVPEEDWDGKIAKGKAHEKEAKEAAAQSVEGPVTAPDGSPAFAATDPGRPGGTTSDASQVVEPRPGDKSHPDVEPLVDPLDLMSRTAIMEALTERGVEYDKKGAKADLLAQLKAEITTGNPTT